LGRHVQPRRPAAQARVIAQARALWDVGGLSEVAQDMQQIDQDRDADTPERGLC